MELENTQAQIVAESLDMSRNSLSETENPKALEQLKEFKKSLPAQITENYNDATLAKFMRAANYNLKKGEMLLRLKENVLALYDLYSPACKMYVKPEAFEKYEVVSHIGMAKDGSPISYIAMGQLDLTGFVHSASLFEISIYCAHHLEADLRKAKEYSEKTGVEVNEVTYIIDFEGFHIKPLLYTHVREVCLDLFQMLQDLYPEIWKRFFVVNASFYFYLAFNICRPIFRSTILQYLYVLSKESTAETLLKYIDADVLPAFLGGNRTDSIGDPRCSEFMKFGGSIPISYYVKSQRTIEKSDPGVESVWIRPRSCYNYPVIVRQINCRFRVQIMSIGGSFTYCMLFRPLGNDPDHPDIPDENEYLDPADDKCNVKIISPYVRMQAHIAPADTIINAPWVGIYIFRFDNSCNWVSGREVLYRIQVLTSGS